MTRISWKGIIWILVFWKDNLAVWLMFYPFGSIPGLLGLSTQAMSALLEFTIVLFYQLPFITKNLVFIQCDNSFLFWPNQISFVQFLALCLPHLKTGSWGEYLNPRWMRMGRGEGSITRIFLFVCLYRSPNIVRLI